MPRRIDIHNRIIATICVKVIAYKIFIRSEVGYVVHRDETTGPRIVVTSGKIIEVEVIIVIVTAVSEGVIACSGRGRVIGRYTLSPRIEISVGNYLIAIRIIDSYYITLQVFLVIVGIPHTAGVRAVPILHTYYAAVGIVEEEHNISVPFLFYKVYTLVGIIVGNTGHCLGASEVILVIGEAYSVNARYSVETVGLIEIAYTLTEIARRSAVGVIGHARAKGRGKSVAPDRIIGVGKGIRIEIFAAVKSSIAYGSQIAVEVVG